MLGLELSLHIDALLEEYALKQGVLVSQHEAFVRGGAMGCIQIGQCLLLDTNGLFKLLDVLGSPLPESCLSLAVSLLPLLCGRVDLEHRQHSATNPNPKQGRSRKATSQVGTQILLRPDGPGERMFTYRLSTSLPLGRLALRGGDGLALLARIRGLSVAFSIRARAQWGLFAILFDRFFLVIIRRLVCCHAPGWWRRLPQRGGKRLGPRKEDRVHRRRDWAW